ncbi:DUF6046 domain-containing protein [Leeuwenhoekiella parthenopeia]|uniref:DUF6046 domain-containing protein n=1 Tax=Leeuwenhoekiella parthenopeia TaxID=2890320 RepID=A0ABS8GMY6_9FLAO|nr:DUF6046 domain-containing protein [Leeuwenhoekiella parthenopeia]MCC4211349.1 DUF6046 domain-containing protein [Leeuwenhoekiella parthenopeia]
MKFSNTDILFASLVGSKVAESIPRFEAVQNELMKHVLPPINFLPLNNNRINVPEVQNPGEYDVLKADAPVAESDQFFPLSFTVDEGKTWYLLPYEPMLNINGKNEIIRRNVAKSVAPNGATIPGRIKERWNRDDYEITITGVLIGSLMTGDVSDCYPIDDFLKLKEVVTAPKSLRVKCALFELLGINQIVIEEFNFPFTKGENVQAYEIKAYSDYDYKLLLDIND